MAHRSRPLNHSELALWREVTKSIRPLRGPETRAVKEQTDPQASLSALPDVRPQPVALSKKRDGVEPAPQKPKAAAPKLLPLAPIERNLLRKISRGRDSVDAVLDLHGLRQHEAHERLRRFLHQSQFNQARLVLVVTGKGNSPHKSLDGETHGKGVLRRLVPDWLRMPDLRSVILGFEEAAPHQGGSGALYVRLRRRRGGGEEA
jgi:DNA-nicking Smr family endonuclease